MSCVLDASATLSFVLADEFTPTSERILDHVINFGAVVPAIWTCEVTNGLLSALRRGRLTEQGVAHALVALDRLPIERSASQPASGELIGLARFFELSTYDASYLWLAQFRDSPLATLDQRLVQVAPSAGVELLN